MCVLNFLNKSIFDAAREWVSLLEETTNTQQLGSWVHVLCAKIRPSCNKLTEKFCLSTAKPGGANLFGKVCKSATHLVESVVGAKHETLPRVSWTYSCARSTSLHHTQPRGTQTLDGKNGQGYDWLPYCTDCTDRKTESRKEHSDVRLCLTSVHDDICISCRAGSHSSGKNWSCTGLNPKIWTQVFTSVDL